MPQIFKPKKKREYNNSKNRDKRQSVYNTTTWRNLRRGYLMQFPLCEICQMEGKTTLAEDIHHMISFLDVPEEYMLAYAYDPKNLIAVCKQCHSRCHTGDLQGTQSKEDIRDKILEIIKRNTLNN